MTQLGESVAVSIGSDGDVKCIFCKKDHQDEEASSATFPKKDTKKLKAQGQSATKADKDKLAYYWSPNHPPLVDWTSDASSYGYGYKAAAHHCLAHSEVVKHEIQGELEESGYDPDAGGNCIMLPYSKLQFGRARALALLARWNEGRADKPATENMKSLMLTGVKYCLQKHSGGHTQAYFKHCKQRLDDIATVIASDFCPTNEKVSKEELKEAAEEREREIWMGVARNPGFGFLKLYNDSFLDPGAAWGTHDSESSSGGGVHKPTTYLAWTGGMLQAFADDPDLQSDIQAEKTASAEAESDGHEA